MICCCSFYVLFLFSFLFWRVPRERVQRHFSEIIMNVKFKNKKINWVENYPQGARGFFMLMTFRWENMHVSIRSFFPKKLEMVGNNVWCIEVRKKSSHGNIWKLFFCSLERSYVVHLLLHMSNYKAPLLYYLLKDFSDKWIFRNRNSHAWDLRFHVTFGFMIKTHLVAHYYKVNLRVLHFANNRF